MEFKVEDFVSKPSLEVFDKCTKDNLLLIAGHFGIAVSRQLKKQVIKAELCEALVEKGILSTFEKPEPTKNVDDVVRLKELEVELQRLHLKERELQFELEAKRLDQEKEIHLDGWQYFRETKEEEEEGKRERGGIFEQIGEIE